MEKSLISKHVQSRIFENNVSSISRAHY
ncbi:hypothetical protein OIU74_029306, partial [Salix koriyanagi]